MITTAVLRPAEMANLQIQFESSPHVFKCDQVPGSLGLHGNRVKFINPYLERFRPLAERNVGLSLKCQHGFMRKSFKGNELPFHTDKFGLDVTITIQIATSDNQINPLIVHVSLEEDIEERLNNGDATVVKGREFAHSRPPVKSDWMLGLFLHYSFT